ncbi:alpha/beta hydrolase [Lentibacillus sp. N15]|uniref:alpha/beta fold hydrolase n=1 Tax=Lentibacillus songyuanensis TaxID=3136161 RepID=UPI0031BBC930
MDGNGNYSLSRLMDDIEEVRKHLGIETWYVMGHSFGGILAINYAYSYPTRIKGVILSNVTLNMNDSFEHQLRKASEILNIRIKEIPITDREAYIQQFYAIVEKLIQNDSFYKLQYTDCLHQRQMNVLDKDLGTDTSFQQYIFSSEAYFQDFVPITERIDLPVLVLVGKYDHAVGPDHHETFLFPNMSVCQLDCGHHPYIEEPAVFQQTAKAFVGRVSRLINLMETEEKNHD